MSTHNSDYRDLPGLTGLQLDLLCALTRIQQLDDEHPSDHYLWNRIVTCDVPRLYNYLEPGTIEWVNAKGNEDVSKMLARCAPPAPTPGVPLCGECRREIGDPCSPECE